MTHHAAGISPGEHTDKMNMNFADMTHEQLANAAIRTGKARDNDELIEAGRELQTLVDNEENSQEQADKVIELLRA